MSCSDSRRNSLTADLVLLATTILATLGWMFSYYALRGLPPLLFIGLRFLAASAILCLIGVRQVRSLGRDPAVLCQCLKVGVVMAAAMMCWIMGLRFATEMGSGAFISSLGVVVAPLMAGLMYRAKITPSIWVAVGIAAVGMACLTLREGVSVSTAELFFLAAALASSIQFNLNSRVAGKDVAVLPLTAIQLGVVGLVSLAFSAALESWPAGVSGETAGWFALSVLVSTCLRFYLQVKGQSRTPLSHAAFIMTLEPVWTALLAMAWLGERMRPAQLAGSALILCALVVSRWRVIVR